MDGTIDLGILDLMLRRFARVMLLGWGCSEPGCIAGLTPWAVSLLRKFAITDVIIMGTLWCTAREAVFERMFYQSLKIGFFIVLITRLRYLTETFMNTMIWGGLQLGGGGLTVNTFLSPGEIMLLGVKTTSPLLLYIENLKGITSSIINMPVILPLTLMVLIAWLCFFLVAAHILIALIEFQLLSVFALLLLPWGVFRNTAFLSEGVLGGLVGSAVRLGVLAAVTSIIVPILTSDQMKVATVVGEVPWKASLGLLAAAGVLLLMSWKAPNYAAARLGSGPAMTGQSLVKAGYAAAVGATKAALSAPAAAARGYGAVRSAYAGMRAGG